MIPTAKTYVLVTDVYILSAHTKFPFSCSVPLACVLWMNSPFNLIHFGKIYEFDFDVKVLVKSFFNMSE